MASPPPIEQRPNPPQTDEELRLECARLVYVFGTSEDPVAATEKLFRYIKAEAA